MRTLMFVRIPVDAGNRAIKNGSIGRIFGQFIETYKPEAAYFTTLGGERCGVFVFDFKQPSQMPAIAEPFFFELQARVEYSPAMSPEDLKAGLADLKL
jgi:hypothetical protein